VNRGGAATEVGHLNSEGMISATCAPLLSAWTSLVDPGNDDEMLDDPLLRLPSLKIILHEEKHVARVLAKHGGNKSIFSPNQDVYGHTCIPWWFSTHVTRLRCSPIKVEPIP